MLNKQKVQKIVNVDRRLDSIERWVASDLKLHNFQIEVASADASFRRYFRLKSADKSWVIMDAPPEKEDCESFVYIAGLIESVGVQAPRIYHFNKPQGFMQLSDLGSVAYLDKLNIQSADALYADAIHALSKMQLIQADLLPYDETLLLTEMSLFKDWYLIKHLNLSLDRTQNKIIADVFMKLAKFALQQPVVFVHRDYHPRNLMLTEANNPGVIDFQDAVNGPITYDLVSLIKDCYIAWPRENQLQWIDLFLEISAIKVNRDEFIKELDLMGLQRHLKAIGIFARLNHRDEKPAYLNDIPRTLAYVVDVCQRYDELYEFSKLLSKLNIHAEEKLLDLIK